jgi:D-serine deaminase-like pyridoxal phosphate-dependent protein
VDAAVADLDTPVLVWDLDVVERNIAEMASVASTAGVRLRPHTKTHKSTEIARRQVDAGASGITVAKLGEAEVMVDAGFDDVLIAFPIVGERKLRRLRALMERATIRVTVDSEEVARGLGRVGHAGGTAVAALVEVDTGLHRMGRPAGQPTVELVSRLTRVPGVEIVGLLTHAGHAYRAASPGELHAIAEAEGAELISTAELCARAGVPMGEISVGSTPTARIVAGVAGVTEIRPGTYVFNDVQQMRLGVASEDSCAARVVTTVVARPWENRFVIDAGTKCFSSDGGDGPPFAGRGVVAGRPDLRIDFMNEEHGVGHVEPGGGELAVGDRLEVIPLHVCSCVNLFDSAVGVRGGTVEREMPIEGRGKVR